MAIKCQENISGDVEVYVLYNVKGVTLYTLEKKGGFSWMKMLRHQSNQNKWSQVKRKHGKEAPTDDSKHLL